MTVRALPARAGSPGAARPRRADRCPAPRPSRLTAPAWRAKRREKVGCSNEAGMALSGQGSKVGSLDDTPSGGRLPAKGADRPAPLERVDDAEPHLRRRVAVDGLGDVQAQ